MFRGTSSPAGIAASLFLVAHKHPSALCFSIITTFYFLHPKRIKKVVDMHILSLSLRVEPADSEAPEPPMEFGRWIMGKQLWTVWTSF